MWESGPWLPAWISPDCWIWYWLCGLALAALCARTERPELARLLVRLVSGLALGQSLVALLAYGYALATRPNPAINEVYVVAAVAAAALLLAAAVPLIGVVFFKREWLKSYPSVRDASSRWWRVGVLVAIALAPAQVYVLFAVVGRAVASFLYLEHSLAFVTAAFLLTAVAGGVGLARSVKALSWQSVLVPLACLAQLSLVALAPPAQAMTDAALVTAFQDRLTVDLPATLVMEELKNRRSSRWSSLASSLQTLRESPDQLSKLVSAARSESSGYAGCSMPMLTTTPYHGEPELDLLSVLVVRGELDEPRAWLDDPEVSPDFKDAIRELLGKSRTH